MSKFLKFIVPALELSEKIIVVGSDKTLLQQKRGSEIDLFDEVVRFNRAPTTGFEDFVGNKTTLRVANNHVITNQFFDGYWTGQPQTFIKDLRNAKILHYGIAFNEKDIESIELHESCELFLFKEREMYAEKNPHYSVGVGFILLCIHSLIKPTIIGFNLESLERNHYWEETPGIEKSFHNIKAEQDILFNLEKNKKITILR